MIGQLLHLACNGCGRLLQNFLQLEHMVTGRIEFNTRKSYRTVSFKRLMERTEEIFSIVFGEWIAFGLTGLIRRTRL